MKEFPETIRLRPTCEADLSFVVEAEADPENQPFISPWPRERHAAVLGDPDIFHGIIETPDGRSAGFVIVTGLRDSHRCVNFLRVVVIEKGKGLGRQVVRLVKMRAFSEWKAHRLWLDVKTHNARARALYTSEGFAEEGTLRECLITDGRLESLVVMSILEDEMRLI